MKRFSISLKLAAWYACSLLLGLAIFGVVMWLVLAGSMLSWKDRTLQTRAARVEVLLSSAARDRLSRQLTDAQLSRLLGILPEGEWIELVGNDGTRVFPVGPLPGGMPVLPFAPCPVPGLSDLRVGRDHFRRLCRPVLYAGQAAVLLVPSPLAEDRILLRTFTLGLYRLVPLILLISVAGGYALSRRALRPVDLLIAEAQAVSADDLSRRLTVPAADDQMRRLALAWNDLLARIETAMIRVTQFTADASHELRNPIAYIRAAAEFSLGSPVIDEESREAFRAIAAEAAVTGELLENLLELAHPESTLSPDGLEPVDVRAATETLLRQFAPLAAKKSQALSALHPEASPELLIHPLHLRRIMTIILDNAVKYTPEGGRISIGYESNDGLLLRVADNGIGIAERHLHRVFDRFFRADAARSDGSDGVGLGLPIARWLAERYGGSISIESRVGRGTTVMVAFPASMVIARVEPLRVTSS